MQKEKADHAPHRIQDRTVRTEPCSVQLRLASREGHGTHIIKLGWNPALAGAEAVRLIASEAMKVHSRQKGFSQAIAQLQLGACGVEVLVPR